MTEVWRWFLLTSVLIEIITCQPSRQPHDHDTKKLGKNLMDAKLNQEHSTWTRAYQGVRANRASFDGSEEGVGRLHSGRHLDVFNDESVHVPRYSALQRSASTKRRARSQALRRNKLNSQSLRSHQIHTQRAADRQQEWIYI